MKKTKTTEEETPRKNIAPDHFCAWWYPTKVDPISGASVGGHPDAERTWARKDSGRWNRRTYGLNAATAFQAAIYRDEYRAWISAGEPEPDKPFVSLAAPLDRLKQFWNELGRVLAAINKPIDTPKGNTHEPIDF